jgi:ABC-2 type transport system permease protein
MAGKIAGILGVVFTQLLAWVAFAVLAIYIGGNYLNIDQIQNVSINGKMVLTTAAIALPPFVMLAALLTALGSTLAEAQEAQQATGLFMIPYMLPIYLLQPLMEDPNGPLAVGLSLFPPTSVVTFSLRLGFSQVPTWQIAASIAISAVCALGAIWLAGRAFRLGMLRYGQRLNWRLIFSRKQVQGVGNE